MSICTTQFVRKPLFVDAIQVTLENFNAVAEWCQGDISKEDGEDNHIRVRVHNPRSVRQTKAFVGDWILYAERGYKVYTEKAFENSFDSINESNADQLSTDEITDVVV